MKKRIISWVLFIAIFTGLVPISAVTAFADELTGTEVVQDKYISATVSRKNGGFTVKTVEGDRLKKSDNNKDLLYHDGEFDTSFLSFRVGEGESAKEYIFGGKYENSSDVTVTPSAAGDSITSEWSVDGLTFTQIISLTNESSNESGMVSVSINAKNESGAAVPVRARMLFDTCLGDQDYGFYQYVNESHAATTIQQERVITGAENIPTQMYAADDAYSPSVMAYTIHTGDKPYQMAIGHWNHLASTLFDFTPSTNLDFTNSRNEYMTSDSAYALYYDMGSLENGASAAVSTFYGVFSNHNTPAENSVAVNVTAPIRLELNEAKNDFVSKCNKGLADFSVAVDFSNIKSETAKDLENIALTVQTGSNIRILDDNGGTITGQEFESTNPHSIPYTDVKVGQTVNKELFFEAKTNTEAKYERITIGVYDTSQTNGQISETYKLGEHLAYILLPGSENDVPKVSFAAMTPKTIYTEGTRHLFVTVTNASMLDNRANWTLKAYSENSKSGVTVPHTNITIADGVMDVALTDDIKLATGGWYLQLEWSRDVVGDDDDDLVPTAFATQSAPELHFTVSDDQKFKNDSYGVLAVVELNGEAGPADKKKIYRIYSFKDEEDFAEYKEKPLEYKDGNYGEYSEIVLTFKGEFTATKKKGQVGTYYTAVSTKEMVDGKAVIDNPIVVNDCLDFEDGSLTVYYEDYEGADPLESAVCTEFNGKIYTNGARTDVWSGRAVLTKLEQKKENYSLAPYDENGERISVTKVNGELQADEEENFRDYPIYLIWPNRGAIGRTLSGLLFNFAYGQLGTMYDTDGYSNIEGEIGNVVSFAASMDLSFASPNKNANWYDEAPDTYWSKMKEVWSVYTDKQSPYVFADDYDKAIRALDWSQIDENADDKTTKEVSASVMVRDILFGCGKGFVGVNFSVGVALTNYVSGLPSIQGTISVNTINNWSYGVDGSIDLEVFKVEAKVSFRSKDNVPVPDEFYVFVSGFEPGINIDGLAVCWITGGGGGIKNLYDSIFATKKVPPLKLMLSVSFDIIKVLECEKATLSLGLTGVSISAENIGIKALPGVTAIRRMGLSLEWYPGIDLRANIVVDLLDSLIYGGGYIVLMSPDYKDVFFEIFAKAALNVPNSVPIVGGMQIGGVELGINSDKIWGAVEVLFITLGVTYYWGESSVDFGSGSKTHPTFPELLGVDDVPVGYDAENNRTLYARVGTNTQLMASNLPDDGGLVLMNVSGASLKSNLEKSEHEFNLGTRGDNDAIVQIVYEAESEEEAKSKAAEIKIGASKDANDYGIVLYNGSNLETANANVTYDSTSKKATYVFTVSDSLKYSKTWYMNTPANSDVLLYNVAAVPKIDSVSGSVSGDELTLNWSGSELAELDKVSFYLCESNDEESQEPGHRIGVIEDSAKLGNGSEKLTIPADVPSGEYYIRGVYSKTNEVNGTVFSTGAKLRWTNPNTPDGVVIEDVRAVGDLEYSLTLNDGKNTDGYLVSIYNEDGSATDFEQVNFDKPESGKPTIKAGGKYQTPDPNDSSKTVTFGLTGGKSYVVGVTPYKKVTSSNGEIAVRGAEVKTNAVYLPEAVTPTVSFTADKAPQIRVVAENRPNEEGNVVNVDVPKEVYTSKEIKFTAAVSESVSGRWSLDGGTSTEFANVNSVEIPLSGIEDGEHTLMVDGEAADGDGFGVTHTFTVDTLPPQLLLSAPVNGSFFDKNGKLIVKGVTDADARFTVKCGEDVICNKATVAEMNGTIDRASGVFEAELNIPNPNVAAFFDLSICVSDDVGNTSQPENVTVSHGGLADLKDLEIRVNDATFSNGNVPVPVSGINDAELTLVGTMSNGTIFNITGYNVDWEVSAVSGNASIDDDSKLNISALSQGVITGKLAVADNASRTASLTFGVPTGHTVATSATIGGSVTGGGDYMPGDTVTLVAKPDNGYTFARWTLAGVSGVDTSSATISFTMPDSGNVSAEAKFTAVKNVIQGGGSSGSGSATVSGHTAQGGKISKVKIPTGKSESDYLPYYFDSKGAKIFVPLSAAKDGYMYFIPPITGKYYFGSNGVKFDDIQGRWSESNILFTAYREIFKGVGDNKFAPEDAMERTMVITVLHRLAGSPKASEESGYTDVEQGSWYSEAVAWGKETGIITGYGDGTFGVSDHITREQLCTMIIRFVEYMKYDLAELNEKTDFADADSISGWAKDAVELCQGYGIVNGMPEGTFEPQSATDREQCSAVMERLARGIIDSYNK